MIPGHEPVPYDWVDETSQFDPAGHWNGSDSYFRNYRAWIPKRIVDSGLAEEWLDRYLDDPIHYVPPEKREEFLLEQDRQSAMMQMETD